MNNQKRTGRQSYRAGDVVKRVLQGMGAALALGATTGYGATTYYVWRDNPSPQSPFTNWAMAATSIQEAVDLTLNGDTVLVTNGIYDAGGAVTPGFGLYNRVCVTNAITLRSVNGPSNTLIKGEPTPDGTYGTGAVRCVFLSGNALLSGFTLTNGYTWHTTNIPSVISNHSGAGVLVDGTGSVVSNCIVRNNKTPWRGGGVYLMRGTLKHSTVLANSANYGGGVYVWSAQGVYHCTIISNSSGNGGGMDVYSDGTIADCKILYNYAMGAGGGIIVEAGSGTMRNCELIGNYQHDAQGGGGGYFFSWKLVNCTISGNRAGDKGGGLKLYKDASVTNCIVWGNRVGAGSDSNMWLQTGAATTAVVAYTCSGPIQNGTGNIGSDPVFADADNANYTLSTRSPCIDAGIRQNWMTNAVDLGGNPRLFHKAVDMGAYECRWGASIFYGR